MPVVGQLNQGSRLPIQRSGPPRIGLRCQPRRTTACLTFRNRWRALTSGPVFEPSSIAQACFAAQPHPRQSRTSGWLPRRTIRVGSAIFPQHQHSSDAAGQWSAPPTAVVVMVVILHLHRRAWCVCVGAEHAAIASLEREQRGAAGAPVEVLAGIYGHLLSGLRAAL